MNIHPDITADRVIEAVERHNTTLDNPGFCVRCGADADSVEPDARGYHCDACGEPGVHGAEELLIMMRRAPPSPTSPSDTGSIMTRILGCALLALVPVAASANTTAATLEVTVSVVPARPAPATAKSTHAPRAIYLPPPAPDAMTRETIYPTPKP